MMSGSPNPDFNYTKQFTIPKVGKPVLDYFEKSALVVEIWGTPGVAGARFQALADSTLDSGANNADEKLMDNVVWG